MADLNETSTVPCVKVRVQDTDAAWRIRVEELLCYVTKALEENTETMQELIRRFDIAISQTPFSEAYPYNSENDGILR
jgi:hypothetical protein